MSPAEIAHRAPGVMFATATTRRAAMSTQNWLGPTTPRPATRVTSGVFIRSAVAQITDVGPLMSARMSSSTRSAAWPGTAPKLSECARSLIPQRSPEHACFDKGYRPTAPRPGRLVRHRRGFHDRRRRCRPAVARQRTRRPQQRKARHRTDVPIDGPMRSAACRRNRAPGGALTCSGGQRRRSDEDAPAGTRPRHRRIRRTRHARATSADSRNDQRRPSTPGSRTALRPGAGGRSV